MDKLRALMDEVDTKPMWSKGEIRMRLNGLLISGESIMKTNEVTQLKKYDIIFTKVFGYSHYVLVHKVLNDKVLGIVLSSKEKDHSIFKLEKDRFFAESYATNSYVIFPLEESLKNFTRVYENKKEADQIFKTVKEFYKSHLNLK